MSELCLKMHNSFQEKKKKNRLQIATKSTRQNVTTQSQKKKKVGLKKLKLG